MTSWLAAGLWMIGIVLLLEWFGIVERSREAVRVSRQSFDIVRNPLLSDDAKQAALQHNAKRLFRLAFALIAGGAAAFAIPTGLLWLADYVNTVSWDATLAASLHPAFIVAVTVAAIALAWWTSKFADRG